IAADAIVIATGATPAVPPIPGLAEAGYLTNETAYELEDLPESLIVLGGNYIGLENAQMFARLGSKVTVLELLPQILPTEQSDVAEELLRQFRSEGIEVVTGAATRRVYREKGEVVLEVQVGKDRRQFRAGQVLVATGRKPNTANMGLETVGVAMDEKGFLQVDDTLQTSVPGIYGAGDVIGGYMFVYTAAYEGKLAAENALSEQKQPRDYTPLPWVIFTDPQIAGVGWDEVQARQRGIDAEATTLPLSEVPRAIAARDTRGFIKLIRDRESDKLIGARIVAPEGSELLMEVTLAIKYGLTANEIVSLFHPYLTLSEGIKLAAISFGKEVSALSCCAT
ncbi:MAG: NAD(P)/FAD-dependent oxidoreductase, partial [Calditrichaeota bacterium]